MKQSVPFTGLSLSGFCMQISILLKSAVPLYEGLSVMAEDASSPREKEILTAMSDKLRMGFPFSEAVSEAGCFPAYVTQMTVLGERTGTLDETMEHLSRFYEREYRLGENLRRAVTYPAIMIVMLLVILFILFTRVMPIFSGVYEQLGTSIPDAAQAAIQFGGILSGAALVFAAVLIAAFADVRLTSRPGQESSLSHRLLRSIKNHSSIAKLSALRRFCSVMAMTLHCGMNMAEGCRMAAALVDNDSVLPGVRACERELESGKAFYDSIEPSGLFSGFDLQMIRIGSRAGQLETVMRELEEDYDERSSDALDSLIARLEPAIVSVLAVAVGLVLLSVMLPLAGILSSIG